MMAIVYNARQRIAQAKQKLKPRKFAGMSQKASKEIWNAILKGVQEGESAVALIRKLEKEHEIERAQAALIVRNETSNIRGIAREIQFRETDPLGKGKYTWQGTPDRRECQTCKRIAKRCGKGVPLDQLQKIIEEEAGKSYNPKYPWHAHPSDRCVARRIFS